MSRRIRRAAQILGAASALALVAVGLGVPAAYAEEGDDRIHIMAFQDSDAIILESNGRFAMVDAGEDDAYPDGSDPRYPARPGITRWKLGYEERLLRYMDSLGVTSDNFDFFLGTHPHSDHIGAAADIISTYRPERVYSPEYSDVFISDPNRLWDNLWVYDRMLDAARSVGASTILHLSPDAPVFPEEDSPSTGADEFDFGDLHIKIVNYEEDYKYPGAVADANLFAWGVEVTSHGHKAFLSADIEETDGDETRLVDSGVLGHVDVLKLGHHGAATSNSAHYLQVLSPRYAFATGTSLHTPLETAKQIAALDTRWYTEAEARAEGAEAFVVTFGDDLDVTRFGQTPHVRAVNGGEPHFFAYQDGLPTKATGFLPYAGSGLFFSDSSTPLTDTWARNGSTFYRLGSDGRPLRGWYSESSNWYFLDPVSGAMATGWVLDKGNWYYMHPSGAMATHPSGAMATGWVHSGGNWYYMHPSGVMATGWVQSGGNWYYIAPSGVMSTGWVLDKGNWYYMHPSGAMATGWVQSGGTWYYMHPSGVMATGWIQTGGTWYHLNPTTGAWS